MEIGGYRAEELLGQGASASVYRAVSPAGKSVALKVFDGPYERALDAAKKEAGLTAQVDHPHLARVLALLCDADQIALAVELGAAGSLADLLARRHQLTPPEVLTVIIPIASALATAHERGVVHGDLSPANIVFDVAGRPMLTDLGAARVAIECGLPVAATPGYVAPEVARGGLPDAAADVFSLGAVALHCLSGRPAWNADDLRDVVVQSTIGQWPDPDDADGPRAVLTAIRSALGDTPERRPGAASLVMELSRSGTPEPIDLSVPADATDRTGDAPPRVSGERASKASRPPVPDQLVPRQHRHRAVDSVEAVSQQRIRPIATRMRADTERPTSAPVVRHGHDRRWWFRTAAVALTLAVIGALAVQAGLIWAGSGAKTGA
ncbi:MAG: serine/threonine protein kinase, partial [Actinomycetota bacterium]|nr:serine/threonine protein kinase [Actinomycetota bacterium]